MGNAKVKTPIGESAENSHGRGSLLSCTLESSEAGDTLKNPRPVR